MIDTTTKAYALRKEGLAKLRYVLQEIQAGRLNHQQETWHCGTAHCVFGWLEMHEATAKMPLDKILTLDIDKEIAKRGEDFEGDFIRINGATIRLDENTFNAWARKYKFDLSAMVDTEYYCTVEDVLEDIYDGDAQLPQQFEALETLEKHFLGEVQTVTESPFNTTAQQEANYNRVVTELGANTTCGIDPTPVNEWLADAAGAR